MRLPAPAVRMLLLGLAVGAPAGLGLGVLLARPRSSTPERSADVLAARMARDMSLTGDQAAGVREIVLRHMRQAEAIRDEMQARLEQQASWMDREVRRALKREQAGKWERRLDRYLSLAGLPFSLNEGEPEAATEGEAEPAGDRSRGRAVPAAEPPPEKEEPPRREAPPGREPPPPPEPPPAAGDTY